MVNARPKCAELSISTAVAMAPPTHNTRTPDLDFPPPSPSPASFSSPAPRGIRKSHATQQCLSTMATSISSSPRSTTAASMTSPRVKSPRTPKNGNLPSSEAPLSPQQAPMSMETYFRLLKKSQVLEHLLAMNSYVHSSDKQLRKLQSEKAKTDSVQQKVLAELEKYQKQFVNVQRCFLELIETMTTFCVKEEQLTLGATLNGAVAHAKRVTEERTVNDLQVATVSINCSDRKANGTRPASCSDDTMLSSSSSSLHSPSSPSSCVETQALVAVGQARIKQMEPICAGYERQLVKCEAELTDAIHSMFTKDCLTKIKQYELREQQYATEKAAMLTQVEFLKKQNAELLQQRNHDQESLLVMEGDNHFLTQQLANHEEIIQLFALDLKAELKKGYGVVPSMLDLRWQQYFPTTPMPT